MRLFRKSREKQLEKAALKLEDHCEYWRKWGFADLPSETNKKEKRLIKLARKVSSLGGDPYNHTSAAYWDTLREANIPPYGEEDQ